MLSKQPVLKMDQPPSPASSLTAVNSTHNEKHNEKLNLALLI
jgi:hypothetical protein